MNIEDLQVSLEAREIGMKQRNLENETKQAL